MITFKVPARFGLATFVIGTVFWAGFLIGRNGVVTISPEIPPMPEVCYFDNPIDESVKNS